MRDREKTLEIKPCAMVHASCNVCLASNYESMLAPTYGRVDRLWEVQVGSMVLCICDSCLEALRLKIAEALDPDFEGSLKTAKAAYERLYEHTQHYVPEDDLWALDTAVEAMQTHYGFKEVE